MDNHTIIGEQTDIQEAVDLIAALHKLVEVAKEATGEDFPVLYVETEEGIVTGAKLIKKELSDGSFSYDIELTYD
jgi:hypothetical protein